MIVIENHCVGCDLPCIDCGRKRVPVCYCDRCRSQEDSLYEYNDEQWCIDCVEDILSSFYDEDREVYVIDDEDYEDVSDYINTLYEVTADDYESEGC